MTTETLTVTSACGCTYHYELIGEDIVPIEGNRCYDAEKIVARAKRELQRVIKSGRNPRRKFSARAYAHALKVHRSRGGDDLALLYVYDPAPLPQRGTARAA